MQDCSRRARSSRAPRTRLLVVVMLATGVLVAGCAGSSVSPSTSASSTSASSTAGSRSTRASARPPGALAFAECMRANGVPNFPDAQPGGGFEFHTSAASPAFRAAQPKCQKLLPGGGPGGQGGQSFPPQVRARALARLRGVAQCMRAHGISDFPDPTSTRPSGPGLGEYSEITDYDGVFLLFPATIDMQSPAWDRAAAACGALAESFNHPH